MGLTKLLEWLIELRETIYQLLKDMIKDPDEELDEEIHRTRSGRVTGARAAVSVEVGVHHPPLTWKFSLNWKLIEPLLLGFYGDFLM